MEVRTSVAVDDGFADIKVAWFDGEELRTLSRPAIARRGLELNDMQGATVGGYESDGERWTVFGQAVAAEPTRTEAYATSGLNRVLVHHALREAGFGAKKIVIGTGLPVSGFYEGGRPKLAEIAAKNASLMKPVVSMGEDPMAAILASFVYPQAMMAWIDHVVDNDGNMDPEKCKRVTAVVDVGGRTTDFAVLLSGPGSTPVVDHTRSGSIDLGVLNIYDALLPMLLVKFQTRELSISKISEAVRTGTMTAFGKSYDVSDLVAKASQDVASRLLSEAQKRLGSGVDIDTVLFVGGGAVVLAEALATYPHVTVPPSPEYANARGILKYLTFCEPANEAASTASAQVVQLKAQARA